GEGDVAAAAGGGVAGEARGAILAGGDSKRMGTDKALVEVAGIPMGERVARALAQVVEEVIVVGRRDELAGMRAVVDAWPGRRGPLAGLATALGVGDGRPTVVVGVDQPFLRAATLRRLLDLAEPERAVVPVDRGARQVTCAVYPGSWREEAAHELDRGGSLRSLLERLAVREVLAQEWRTWGEDGRSWFSVDTPEVLRRGEARYV
ncbi:MAG: molybdenum cofactor guanylyltransferase, partial [Acidimicrobiia bacterium]